MIDFAFGQWVTVKAEVVTARKYQPQERWGETAVSYGTQGRRKGFLCPDDWLVVHAPEAEYGAAAKVCLLRRELAAPLRMLVVGKTCRATGNYYPGGQDEAPVLVEDKRHAVYLLRRGLRWATPMMALADDMEVAL